MQGARLTALLVSAIKLLRIVVIAVLTYIVLAKAFGFFPWTREHSQRLLGYVVDPLIAMGQALLAYLPNLFYIFVIVVVIHFVLRFLRIIAGEVERGRIKFPGFYPEWVQPTYKIVRFLLYALAVVIIFPYLPFEKSPAFKGISVFLGVLFSLGSTSAVANFVAGIILIYTRGFRIGDWVTIGENTGEVVQQSMLATHVRTIRNEEITIPNSVVLGSYVTNFSLQAQEQGVVLHTSVTIGYDAPWRTIHKLLIDAALRTTVHPARSAAVRAAGATGRFVREVRDQRLYRPSAADAVHLFGPARQHPGQLLRGGSGDHVAGVSCSARRQPHGDSRSSTCRRTIARRVFASTKVDAAETRPHGRRRAASLTPAG